eukprot:COSAG01_NODE_990_length_12289_cov_22.606545_10_plen_75_part_00
MCWHGARASQIKASELVKLLRLLAHLTAVGSREQLVGMKALGVAAASCVRARANYLLLCTRRSTHAHVAGAWSR